MFVLSYRSFTAIAFTVLAAVGAWGTPVPAAAQSSQASYTVTAETVADLKAVFATVQSVDVVPARSRIGGTVSQLRVDEGQMVKKGEIIAVISDPKLPLELLVVGARIESLRAQHELARLDLARARKLRKSGAGSQARLDAATTAVDVALRSLRAMQAERNLVSARLNEGKILAPTAGRVLRVSVTDGTVVMPGESVATVAQARYILRLHLPERHARTMKIGDSVHFPDGRSTGRVRQIYPELDQGRVVADADVAGLGDFFVGERVRVLVGTGKRTAFLVPTDFTYRRYGLTMVRLAARAETVIEIGEAHNGRVEVLSGLAAGDVIVRPGAEVDQ